MRTLIHAALLAGLSIPVAGLAQSATAADLDYGYDYGPRPVRVLPPPVEVLPPPLPPLAVPPRCSVYRPCFRPYSRFSFYAPRPYRFGYERPYARLGGDRYGYDRPRDRFDRDRYGDRRGYGAREHVKREGRPYADPLGHDRFERPRGEQRFDHYGDDERRRGDEQFGRGPGPDFRGERGPGYRGEDGPDERG